MASFYGRSGPSELLPRSIFLKPLVTGRRVLELGTVAATGGATAVALLRLGARTVTAFDEDEAAVERARQEQRGSGVAFRTGRTDELPERSFDLALVEDAARIVRPGAAASLGRLLSPTGQLVVPIRNPAGPSLASLAGASVLEETGWAEATAALRPFFPSIEVATQQLLVGYVLAPVRAGAAKLDIDASAAGTAAAYWLLLCGQRPTGLTDQTLVALPPEPLFDVRREPVTASTGAPDEVELARAELARLTAMTAELQAALAAERRRAEELRQAADRAAEGLRERENWVDGLRSEVEDREESETQTQAALRVATIRLGRVEPELKTATETIKKIRDQLADKIHELAAARQGISERNHDLRLAEEEIEKARQYARQEREARLAAEQAAGRLAEVEARLAAAEAERDALLERAAPLAESADEVEVDASPIVESPAEAVPEAVEAEPAGEASAGIEGNPAVAASGPSVDPVSETASGPIEPEPAADALLVERR